MRIRRRHVTILITYADLREMVPMVFPLKEAYGSFNQWR